MIPFHAVLLAGGIGSRLASEVPKQFLPLGEKRVIEHSLDVLLAMPGLQNFVVVCDPAYREWVSCGSVDFALPGKRRQDSLHNALRHLPEDESLVLVHDAARPFINEAMVERVLTAAKKTGAATTALPASSTIKAADTQGTVISTLDRQSLWEIQTPQVVRAPILRQAFKKCVAEGVAVTDDVSLAELVGNPVQLVEGSPHNIKVTHQSDYEFAQYLVNKEQVLT